MKSSVESRSYIEREDTLSIDAGEGRSSEIELRVWRGQITLSVRSSNGAWASLPMDVAALIGLQGMVTDMLRTL